MPRLQVPVYGNEIWSRLRAALATVELSKVCTPRGIRLRTSSHRAARRLVPMHLGREATPQLYKNDPWSHGWWPLATRPMQRFQTVDASSDMPSNRSERDAPY